MNVAIRHGGREWELSMEWDDIATLGDLAHELGIDSAEATKVDATPAPLDALLNDLALHHGTLIEFDPADQPDEPAVEITVVGGLGAGASIALPPGEYVIGSGPESNLIVHGVGVRPAHAVLTVTAFGPATVQASNGAAIEIDGSAASGRVELAHGALLRLGTVVLAVAGDPPATPPRGRPGRRGTMTFSRPPRLIDEVRVPAIRIPPAPAEPPPAGRFRWATVIAPLVVGAALAMIFSPVMLVFAVLGPVMVIANWYEDRSRTKHQRRDAGRHAEEAVGRLGDELDAALEWGRAVRIRTHPSIAAIIRRAFAVDGRLWERRPQHADFLQVLAGYGDVPWQPEVVEPPGPALEEAIDAVAKRSRIRFAPVALDLGPGQIVGLLGPTARARAAARQLVLQVAVHHGPADVSIAVATDQPAHWDWAKWLPHSIDDVSAASRLLASTTDETSELLHWLTEDVTETTGAGSVVVVVDVAGLSEPRHARLRDALAGGGRPLAALVVGPELPSSCTRIVEYERSGYAVLREPQGGSIRFLPVLGDEEAARATGRAMAGLEDPDLRHDATDLPDTHRLLDLIGLDAPTPAGVLERWRRRSGFAAPIGIGARGPIVIDLVGDGPHGLVAGTTGSGKSELLRTLVAALAASCDPDSLNFVLIDYKGGSAFDACVELPHTVGMVTDLEGHLGERALTSLEAELAYRETRLRGAGAADIAEFHGRDPEAPLPRLLVIVDEFAALARELPDFVVALVDIAQRGRSLGVHLLLATQRPSGVVSENIRANANLRISLRVQDTADSLDVLGHPQAASIGRAQPGRAYLRSGPDEIVPFQTALVSTGAAAKDDPGVGLTPFVFARQRPTPETEAAAPGSSDLEQLVTAINAAARQARIAEQRRPWLPPLPSEITSADVARHVTDGERGAAVGLVDDPPRQRQVSYAWEPASGPLLVYGSGGSGTTTFLRALVEQLAVSNSPDDLHIYILDFDRQQLLLLEKLPHVGAAVGAHELERQRRLLRHLRGAIEARRRAAAAGEAAERPRVVVLVDDYTGLKAAAEDHGDHGQLDAFHRIVGDGPAFGVTAVIAAKRATAVPASLTALIPERLVFRLADPAEYSAFGIYGRQLPHFRPGRAVIASTGHEVQMIVPNGAVATGAGLLGAGPAPIDILAAEVKVAEVVDATRIVTGDWSVPLGIGDEDLVPVGWRLRDGDHGLIAGGPKSGKSTSLAAIAECVGRHRPDTRIVAAAFRPSPLVDSPYVEAVEGAADLDRILCELADPSQEALLLVDDAELVTDESGPLQRLLARRATPLRLIAAGRPQPLRGAFGHWTQEVRRSGNGLALQPDPQIDGDLWQSQLPRRGPDVFPPGRGYLISDGSMELIQAARP